MLGVRVVDSHDPFPVLAPHQHPTPLSAPPSPHPNRYLFRFQKSPKTPYNLEFTSYSRNIGMGTSTSAARLGSFSSPYVVHLVSKCLWYTVFRRTLWTRFGTPILKITIYLFIYSFDCLFIYQTSWYNMYYIKSSEENVWSRSDIFIQHFARWTLDRVIASSDQ